MDAKPSIVDLSNRLYRFAKRGAYAGHPGSGFDLCGAGQKAVGVIQEGKPVGKHSTVATGNQLKVVAGGAIANAGTRIASDAEGRAVAAAAGNEILGRTIAPVAAVGDLVEIEFSPEGLMV
jgi:hypothetical protein